MANDIQRPAPTREQLMGTISYAFAMAQRQAGTFFDRLSPSALDTLSTATPDNVHQGVLRELTAQERAVLTEPDLHQVADMARQTAAQIRNVLATDSFPQQLSRTVTAATGDAVTTARYARAVLVDGKVDFGALVAGTTPPTPPDPSGHCR